MRLLRLVIFGLLVLVGTAFAQSSGDRGRDMTWRYLGASYDVEFHGTYVLHLTNSYIKTVALRSFVMSVVPATNNTLRFELERGGHTSLLHSATASPMESAGCFDGDSFVFKNGDKLVWRNSNTSSLMRLVYTITD